MSTTLAIVKPNFAVTRWAGKPRRRTSVTVAKHVAVLEAVAEEHGGVLPPYKWLNENGYFYSYNVMLDHPSDFKHVKTWEQAQAEMYKPSPGAPQIMRPKKFKTLAEYNIKGAHFSPTCLALDPGMSEKEWMSVGRAITTLRQSAHWWVGDFLQYGKRTYGVAATFDLARQATGYTRSQLYSAARIAKKFPPERRVEALTVFHHQAVSSAPPEIADRLLAEAVEIGLTARQIKQMADEECGKGKSRFDRKTVSVVLWQTTYDMLKARADGKNVGWFIADIIEEYLTGKPVQRYANGRKLKDFKAAIIAAHKAGELDHVEAQ
jgi:hypothetical protein